MKTKKPKIDKIIQIAQMKLWIRDKESNCVVCLTESGKVFYDDIGIWTLFNDSPLAVNKKKV